MALQTTEVRTGFFVVTAVAILTVLIFTVGDFRSRLSSTASYHTYLSDAKLLKRHDLVTYGGVRVGQVSSIEPSLDRLGQVRIELLLDPKVGVKEDSTVILKQDGMLGPKYLEVTPGSSSAKSAPPGTELRGFLQPSVADVAGYLEKPLERADRLLEQVEKILGSQKNQENLASILSDGRDLLASLRKEVEKVGSIAGRSVEKAEKVLDELHGLLDESRPAVARVLQGLEKLSANFDGTANELRGFIQGADGLVTKNNRNVTEAIRVLRDTAYHLERAARRLRADPSVLLFGGGEPDEELKRADETRLLLQGRVRRYDKEDPR